MGQKKAEGHLRQAQKMEAIGRLAGGIAHDFNNLLMVISGLRRPYGRSTCAGKRPAAQCRTDSGGRATGRGLTQQLLAFSRKQMLAPKF